MIQCNSSVVDIVYVFVNTPTFRWRLNRKRAIVRSKLTITISLFDALGTGQVKMTTKAYYLFLGVFSKYCERHRLYLHLTNAEFWVKWGWKIAITIRTVITKQENHLSQEIFLSIMQLLSANIKSRASRTIELLFISNTHMKRFRLIYYTIQKLFLDVLEFRQSWT